MITPKFWMYRRKKSDRIWIENQMKYVPADKQQEVSDQYERILRSDPAHIWNSRDKANSYLLAVAREYRQDAYVKKNQS